MITLLTKKIALPFYVMLILHLVIYDIVPEVVGLQQLGQGRVELFVVVPVDRLLGTAAVLQPLPSLTEVAEARSGRSAGDGAVTAVGL